MKVFSTNKKVKWQDKVKIIKSIILFVLLFILLFLLLYFVVGGKTLLLRAIITSLVIALLITAGYITSCILNYEEYIPVIKDKELYIIIKQRETDFYDTDIKRKIDIDFEDEKEVSKVLSKDNKNVGLAFLKVSDCDIIKEKNDNYKIRVKGVLTKWKFYDRKKSFGYELKDFDHKRIIYIDNTYKDYKELIKFIKKVGD